MQVGLRVESPSVAEDRDTWVAGRLPLDAEALVFVRVDKVTNVLETPGQDVAAPGVGQGIVDGRRGASNIDRDKTALKDGVVVVVVVVVA